MRNTFQILERNLTALDKQYNETPENDLATKAKILILMNEISLYKDIYDPKSSDGRLAQLVAENIDEDSLHEITLAFTNHPTNPFGHQATIAIFKLKEAIVSGVDKEIKRKIQDFLKIEEVVSKRTTDQSYYVINYISELAWDIYDKLNERTQKLISLEDWRNDADGNPNKTLAALQEGLVTSNKKFQECLLRDLIKINEKSRTEPQLQNLIKEIKNFDIDESNFLNANKLAEQIRNIEIKGDAKKKLLKLAKKVEHFGSFITKPQIRQEGGIYHEASNLLGTKFKEANKNPEGYKFSFNKAGDIIAEKEEDNFILFKKEEFAQTINSEGKREPLDTREKIAIDHFAKLVYLSNQPQEIVRTFIMSEFQGTEEMTSALRLLSASGIDTKKVNLFPLFEEIENYHKISTFTDVLKKSSGSQTFSKDEELIKKYIDDTGTIRVMFAASDTTKRGGVEANFEMSKHLVELCDAIAAYNATQPDNKKIKLSYYHGGGPSPARGGAEDFIRKVKSIAGDRGVQIEISTTVQGEMVNRHCDPINLKAYLETIENGYTYQMSRNIQDERSYIKEAAVKNEKIWKKVSKVLGLFGNTFQKNPDYVSEYRKFAEENLTTENQFLNLLFNFSKYINTSDRADGKPSADEGKKPFYKKMRAIGYDLMSRMAGFNNIILGHSENLEKYFKDLAENKTDLPAKDLQTLYNESTVFKGQIDAIAKIIGLTDINFLEKIVGTLAKKDGFSAKDTTEFAEKIKKETQAIAKFAAISTGLADANTPAEDAYETVRAKFSPHLKKPLVEKAQDLMLKLCEGIAKGEIKPDNLGEYKTILAAFIEVVRSDPIISATLEKKKAVMVDMERGGVAKIRT